MYYVPHLLPFYDSMLWSHLFSFLLSLLIHEQMLGGPKSRNLSPCFSMETTGLHPHGEIPVETWQKISRWLLSWKHHNSILIGCQQWRYQGCFLIGYSASIFITLWVMSISLRTELHHATSLFSELPELSLSKTKLRSRRWIERTYLIDALTLLVSCLLPPHLPCSSPTDLSIHPTGLLPPSACLCFLLCLDLLL